MSSPPKRTRKEPETDAEKAERVRRIEQAIDEYRAERKGGRAQIR